MAFDFEPETARYLARFAAQPARENQTLEDLRQNYRDSLIADSLKPVQGISSRNLVIEGQASTMNARIYVPDGAPVIGPLLLYVHGGGFAVGDLESHDGLARLITTAGAIRVLTFEYRRAPENVFPAAVDDVLSAFAWVTDHAEELSVDPTRFALGGESAGAAHAMAAAVALKDMKSDVLKAIWLMSPALDATCSGESYIDFATGAGRTAAEFNYLWSLYVPNMEDRRKSDVSPVFADLNGLSPLYIYTAEFDPARSDGETLAKEADRSGVPVVLKQRSGLIHQYPEMTGVSTASRQAVEAAARDLGDALG